jgi:hypothetical protein
MRRQSRRTFGTVLAVGLPLAASGAPAAARTTGNESFKGAIVTSGESGTRTVVSSVIAASGVFTGSGRVVEVDSRPGDPGNVNRDDLVFPQGTMHIRSTSQTPAMSLNPQTCVLTVRIKQGTKIITGSRRNAQEARVEPGRHTYPDSPTAPLGSSAVVRRVCCSKRAPELPPDDTRLTRQPHAKRLQ